MSTILQKLPELFSIEVSSDDLDEQIHALRCITAKVHRDEDLPSRQATIDSLQEFLWATSESFSTLEHIFDRSTSTFRSVYLQALKQSFPVEQRYGMFMQSFRFVLKAAIMKLFDRIHEDEYQQIVQEVRGDDSPDTRLVPFGAILDGTYDPSVNTEPQEQRESSPEDIRCWTASKIDVYLHEEVFTDTKLLSNLREE